MTEKIGYKLNPKKLKGAPQSILPYVVGAFYYTEDFEYFDVIKPYLDIPEPPKSLEEIQQECEEKFDDLIERTKNSFYKSKYIAETLYDTKFNRIIENFEYAKEHGYFKKIYTLDGSYIVSNGGGSVSFTTQYRAGDGEVGFWSIQPNIQVYLKKKPNMIVRFFTKLLLDFEWKSTK